MERRAVVDADELLDECKSELSDDADSNNDDDASEDLACLEGPQVADPPHGHVRMRPSLFRNMPGTVFFEYPMHLNMSRQEPSKLTTVKTGSVPAFRCYWERKVVKDAFLRAGFKRTKGSAWTALWDKHQPKEQLEALGACQKANHFPGSWCIGRKDRLLRTLQKFKRNHPSERAFSPEGYIFPAERAVVARQLEQSPETLFIMKPLASSCGRGIKIVHSCNFDSIPKNKKAILQRYVKDPYLIHNKKFDLRIYVLVTSVDPLRVYMFEEGLVRFSTETYTLRNLKNRRIHITNFSVHKHSEAFSEDVGTEEGVCGHKWSLPALQAYLAREHGAEAVNQMMQGIEAVIVKTMIAASSEIAPSVYKHCHRHSTYELFGFDILLDRRLRPWLLEVNVSPSLMASSPLDVRVKGMLMADVLHLVGQFHKLRKVDKAHLTTNFLQSSLKGQDGWRQGPDVRSIALQKLTEDDFRLMLEIEDEWSRKGHFKLLYPVKESVLSFLPLFESARFYNTLLARWVLEGGYSGRVIRPLLPLKYYPIGWGDLESHSVNIPPTSSTGTTSRTTTKRKTNSRRIGSTVSSSGSVSTEMTTLTAATSCSHRAVHELRKLRQVAAAAAAAGRSTGQPPRSAQPAFHVSPRGIDNSVEVRTSQRLRQFGVHAPTGARRILHILAPDAAELICDENEGIYVHDAPEAFAESIVQIVEKDVQWHWMRKAQSLFVERLESMEPHLRGLHAVFTQKLDEHPKHIQVPILEPTKRSHTSWEELTLSPFELLDALHFVQSVPVNGSSICVRTG